jgi:hypothetical protein
VHDGGTGRRGAARAPVDEQSVPLGQGAVVVGGAVGHSVVWYWAQTIWGPQSASALHVDGTHTAVWPVHGVQASPGMQAIAGQGVGWISHWKPVGQVVAAQVACARATDDEPIAPASTATSAATLTLTTPATPAAPVVPLTRARDEACILVSSEI